MNAKNWLISLVLLSTLGGGTYFIKTDQTSEPSTSNPTLVLRNGLDLEVYKPESVVVKLVGSGFLVQGVWGAGFRIKNESARPQLLVLEGENILGKGVLRTETKGNAPRWSSAPDGEVYYIQLDPQRETQVLIYQDKSFKYQLNKIHIEDCASCISADEFKNSLISQNPKLKLFPDGSNWEVVATELLNYAANKVDSGITSRSGLSASYPPHVLSRHFDENSAEGSCGLFAIYLADLLNLFGISALTIDFGIDVKNNLTHVTTIVKAPNEKFYIFDPTFNGTYRLKDGTLADLNLVLSSQVDSYFREKKIRRDIWLTSRKFLNFQNMSAIRDSEYDVASCTEKSLGEEGFKFCPDVPYDRNYLFDGWAERLGLHGIGKNDDLFKTFLKRGEVYNVSGVVPSDRLELIENLKRLGVKFREGM